MITPRLEKALLAGWATFKVVNHAFGVWGSITIPKGSTFIITHIKWNHFLNPLPRGKSFTYGDLLRDTEYQLKVDCNKNINYLIFKNKFDFKITDPAFTFNNGTPFNKDNFLKYIFPIHAQPIIQDVFFVAEEFINITITRNVYQDTVAATMGNLNKSANQQNSPVGIGDLNVLLHQQMTEIGGNIMEYVPPQYKAANLTAPPQPQTFESYMQPYSKNSLLSDPTASRKYTQDINFAFPLVELGIVTFNNSYFDKIMNG